MILTDTSVWIEFLKGMLELRTVSLQRTAIGDAGLRHLRGLSRLEKLDRADALDAEAQLARRYVEISGE